MLVAGRSDKVVRIGQNGVMMSQVVLSPSSDGGGDLRISQVEMVLPTQRVRGSELHLGSQDLIRFAGYAVGRGFVVASFMLADAYLMPLDEDEQLEISAEMIDILGTYGMNEFDAAMQDDFDGLYVVGVNLIESTSGMRISVRRRGFVETSIIQEAERLLKDAWRELRLS